MMMTPEEQLLAKLDQLISLTMALDTKVGFLEQDLAEIKENTLVLEETLVKGVKTILESKPQGTQEKPKWTVEKL